MHHLFLYPALAILAGAAATVPSVQNSTNRAVLYWLVISPMALGLFGAVCLLSLQ